ncbi:hypothetical protein R3I94_019722 [Phoxinus phoxinus]
MSGTGEGGAIVVFLFISNPCRGSPGKAEDFSPPFKLRGKPTTKSLVHVLKSKPRTLGGGNISLKARWYRLTVCTSVSTFALDTRSRTFSLICDADSQEPRDLPETRQTFTRTTAYGSSDPRLGEIINQKQSTTGHW